MKIFYIANIRLPSPKAHGIQIMKMCEALSLQGVKVELIVSDRRNTVGVSSVFEYYGVKPIFEIRKLPNTDLLGRTMRFGKLFYWVDFLIFFIKLFNIKVGEGSIIYGRDPILNLPFVWRRCQTLIEVHDVPRVNFLFFKLLSYASGFVTITNYLKDVLLEKGISGEKIIVSPDGVDFNMFNINLNKQEARTILNLNKAEKLVIYTGSLQKWKGTDTLEEASRLLEEVKVLLVTDKPHHEMPLYLKTADVLVIPNSGETRISRFFTSPLKLFEYMISTRPIVASDLPSLREILDDSMAYFFEPDNPRSLAEVIKYVLDNKEEAEEKAQRAFLVAKEYTWEKRARKIIEFIK